jgi:hypothetical protein
MIGPTLISLASFVASYTSGQFSRVLTANKVNIAYGTLLKFYT